MADSPALPKPLKIVMISLNYRPEPVGIGPYSAGLAEGLAARGHEVRVIAGRPYYPDWRAYPGTSPVWQRETVAGVRVTRCPHYIPRSPTGPRRLIHHASFMVSAFWPALLAAGRSADLVIVVAPSLLAVPVGWTAARFSGAKLWLHVQDLELDAAIATGLVPETKWWVPPGRLIVRALLRRADRISSISRQMCAKIVDKGVAPERVFELRNWANHEAVLAAPADHDFCREWGLGQRKVVLYSGNIANKQGLPLVIEAARRLSGREDIVFVICGQGPNRAELEAQASGLGNVQFHDLQPPDRFGALLKLAHVHLLPQLADAADLVLPSKLANMLASGRPIVATAAKGTGIADEVEGCGLVVPPGDPGTFAAAIARLVDDPGLADRLGEAGSARAAERWTSERIIARAARGFVELVEQGR